MGPAMKVYLLSTAVIAWSGIAASMLVREPDKPLPPVAPLVYFEEVSVDPAPKADRLDLPPEIVGPIPVITEKIEPAPQPAEVAALPPPQAKVDDEPSPRRRRHQQEKVDRDDEPRGSDICSRHGMHKVWVTERRWRCRR